MSKNETTRLALAASADETTQLLRAAKTDSDPNITYDPENRPEVSNLVLLSALSPGIDPTVVAEEMRSRPRSIVAPPSP